MSVHVPITQIEDYLSHVIVLDIFTLVCICIYGVNIDVFICKLIDYQIINNFNKLAKIKVSVTKSAT